MNENNSEIIAKKSRSVNVAFTIGIIFNLAGIVFTGLVIYKAVTENPTFLFSLLFIIPFYFGLGLLFCFVSYKGVKAPKQLIVKNGNQLIVFVKEKIMINRCDVIRVDYIKDSGKGFSFSFGTITVTLKNGEKYKVRNANQYIHI